VVSGVAVHGITIARIGWYQGNVGPVALSVPRPPLKRSVTVVSNVSRSPLV
jgi:hypothetical protein